MNNSNNKKIKSSLGVRLLPILLAITISCSRIYDNIEKYADGEIVYIDQLDGIERVLIGYERVEIDLLKAGRIPASQIRTVKASKTVIECEDFTEQGNRRVIDSVCSWVNVTGLTELKNYRLTIYLEDNNGRRSLALTTDVRPYTKENLDALELLPPTVIESSSAALVEWREGISGYTHKVFSYTWRYTDKDLIERTGEENGDMPSFFVENVTKGVDIPLTLTSRVVPTLSNFNGTYTPIIDTIDWQASYNLRISENATSAIFLKTPSNTFNIDFNNDAAPFPLTFSWIKADEANAYTLNISSEPTFQAGTTYTFNAGDADQYMINADEGLALFDFFSFSTSSRKIVPLYWTVTPTEQTTPIRTQTRRIQLIPVSLLNRVNTIGGCVGLWEFDNTFELMKATIGNDLVAYWREPAVLSGIGTLSMQGVSACNGLYENDGAIEVITHPTALFCNHGITPTTGKNTVTEYTILYDIRPVATWPVLLNTNVLNDGNYELAINGSLAVGLSADVTYNETYSSQRLMPNNWYCLAVTLKAPEYYRIYVNGEIWYTANYPENERLQLSPEGLLFFAAHPNSTQTQIQVSSLAVFNKALSEEELKSLGEL